MTYLYATLHTRAVTLRDRTRAFAAAPQDEGASTIEIVFWAVALLGLAGVVFAALQAYINTKISNIH